MNPISAPPKRVRDRALHLVARAFLQRSLLCALILFATEAARSAVPEAELKSVLLFHLTQFVQWPPAALRQAFAIGVLGPDEFGPALDQAVGNEQIAGKPIQVRHGSTASELAGCQIIYVSSEARQSMPQIRAELGPTPALLVGESADFLAEGGMIRFALTNSRKIQLEVQLDHLRSAGLSISAQLLRVCVVQGSSAQ